MNAVSKQQWPAVKYTATQLGGGTNAQGVAYPGGLDLTTPALRLQPGALRDVLNFEVAQFGGYARVDGYERVDGRAAPSAAFYTIVQMASNFKPADFTTDLNTDFDTTASTFAAPFVGQQVTQSVTGATGTIIAVVSSPVSYLVLTKTIGAFDQLNLLSAGGGFGEFIIGVTPIGGDGSIGPIGFATALTVTIDPRTHAIYTALAADNYRADILAVPGEGPILGVVAMAFRGKDELYAFRGSVGQATALLWQASSIGWVQVPYLNLIDFTAGGLTVPFDGETLTQGVVTATIKRVMWQSGAWSAVSGSAVGQFVIDDPTGGAFVAGPAATTSGATLTLAGPHTPITMQSRGRFEFEKCNFGGQLVTRRIYGCDGVNPAFEFDGEVLAPIKTGLTVDRPTHIKFHKNFLFLTQDASLLFCGAGTPFKWSAVDGAGEIATGDTVTGMITLPGSQTTATLGVFLRTNTAFLYGSDPSTFNFVTFSTGIGAVPYSIQNLFDTFFLDSLGVVTLKTTLNWGNFLPSTLTKNILPFIARERGNLVASAVNREKSQYRLFFSDGFVLLVTVLNQQYLGCGLALFPDPVTCVDTSNLLSDDEVSYAGGTSGFVYQLDIGTSFDGAAIPAYILTAWDAVRSPRILKRFRAASIEVQGGSFAEIQYGYQLGYDSNQVAQPAPATLTLNLGDIPVWDSFVWDAFVWDGEGLSPTDIDQTGTAENVRVLISSGTNYMHAFTVNSIIHHYSMRRGLRV